MKRLAKLGGSNHSGPSTPSSASNGTPSQPSPAPQIPTASSPSSGVPKASTSASYSENATSELDLKRDLGKPSSEQPGRHPAPIKVTPRPTSPAKRGRDGSERRSGTDRSAETIEVWQDRILRQVFRVTLNVEEINDSHGHPLIFLPSTKDDLEEQQTPLRMNIEVLEGAITEAASKAPGSNPFEYLLACFKRASRAMRSTKFSGPDDQKEQIMIETKRLCMSYCIFAVTMPEMFGETVPSGNPLVHHMLKEPESDTGICYDFLTEASARFEEDDSIKDAVVGALEELSERLATKQMLGEERAYINGLRNFLRFPQVVDAATQSPKFNPSDIPPQDIETKTLLGPFFRLSPMQLEVATNHFTAPRTRDRTFISSAQNAVRLTLRTHQAELFAIADTVVKAGPGPRGRLLDWFAACVNKNHKKRAMRVDYKTVSSDGFMVNVTSVLDQLCEPFMDARFGKVERIDPDYLRRDPRVDISDETKINADQKAADDFYAQKADGTNNFISEVFFLTVAAHHYGTEAAQTRMSTLTKTVRRMEKDLEAFEAERHKYINVGHSL